MQQRNLGSTDSKFLYRLRACCTDLPSPQRDVAKYLGRNYFYRLNETLNIDASRVGNEARFINHAPSWQVNCHAEGASTFKVDESMRTN